jgi:deazaflavin-dependent oxidoreductase (nitroreductase family)
MAPSFAGPSCHRARSAPFGLDTTHATVSVAGRSLRWASMRTARRIARFNRVVTNRIQMVWAWLIPPWTVVVHRGRHSGRRYRTPVIAYRHGAELTIGLPYGEDADWVRNLVTARGGSVLRAGRELALDNPHVVDRDGHHRLPAGARWAIVPSRKVLVGTLRSPHEG